MGEEAFWESAGVTAFQEQEQGERQNFTETSWVTSSGHIIWSHLAVVEEGIGYVFPSQY